MNCEFRWNFDEREKIVDIQLTVNLVMSNNIYCWTDVIMLRELIGRSLQNMNERHKRWNSWKVSNWIVSPMSTPYEKPLYGLNAPSRLQSVIFILFHWYSALTNAADFSTGYVVHVLQHGSNSLRNTSYTRYVAFLVHIYASWLVALPVCNNCTALKLQPLYTHQCNIVMVKEEYKSFHPQFRFALILFCPNIILPRFCFGPKQNDTKPIVDLLCPWDSSCRLWHNPALHLCVR